MALPPKIIVSGYKFPLYFAKKAKCSREKNTGS
jgi:hypothetical protein